MTKLRSLPLALLLGCASAAPTAPTDMTGPTWHGNVRPIVEARCAPCHYPTGSGGVEFTYPATAALGDLILPRIRNRTMPPWMPTAGIFQGDRSLRPGELDTIEAFFAAGAPEGDPATYPGALPADPAPAPPQWPADISLRTAAPAPSSETYRCIALALPSTGQATAWTWEVPPGSHHAAGWVVDGTALATLPRDWFDCSGGLPVPTIAFLSSVGGGPSNSRALPAGAGIDLPPGAGFILQLHSLPAAAAEAGISLWFAPPGASLAQVLTVGVQAPVEVPPWMGLSLDPASPSSREYAIEHSHLTPPANIRAGSDYILAACGKTLYQATHWLPYGQDPFVVETDCAVPLSVDGQLIAVQPHLHTRGKWVELTISHRGATPVTVIRIDDWDYRWEEQFYLRVPIRLTAGDTAYVTCGIGNGKGDQLGRDGSVPSPGSPVVDPEDAHYLLGGLERGMEMCAVFLTVVKQ